MGGREKAAPPMKTILGINYAKKGSYLGIKDHKDSLVPNINCRRNHKGKCCILLFHQRQAKNFNFNWKSLYFLFFIKSFKPRFTILGTKISEIILIQYLEIKSSIWLNFSKYRRNRILSCQLVILNNFFLKNYDDSRACFQYDERILMNF